MEEPIAISNLNDFIFCPASIYFHNLHDDLTQLLYQTPYQINGSAVHEAIDTGGYSSKKSTLQAISVYSEKYNIIGKIDLFDTKTKTLRERKKKISIIYDGYIFQVYAQYFSLCEMGYDVQKIQLYSYDDNKTHIIPLPKDNPIMQAKFENVINDINNFNLTSFIPDNPEKCRNCVYSPFCDRTLAE